MQEFVGHEGRVTRAVWGPLNRTILSAGEDGTLRLWDVETGTQLAESREHKKQINDLNLSTDGTHCVTASLDKTAKVFDAQTLECLKTFSPERPVNAAVLSPIFDHVILGGGQDAMSVTLTSSKAGKFESKVYHKVFGEEIGGIKGHFGPINALAISPDGRSFSSGGEDGFVRVCHFDADVRRRRITPTAWLLLCVTPVADACLSPLLAVLPAQDLIDRLCLTDVIVCASVPDALRMRQLRGLGPGVQGRRGKRGG